MSAGKRSGVRSAAQNAKEQKVAIPIDDRSEEKLTELRKVYEGIAAEPENLAKNREIEEFYKKTIMDMSERVLKNLAAKYENIVKGVGSVMGGQEEAESYVLVTV